MNETNEDKINKIVENLLSLHPLLAKSLTREIRSKTNLNPGSLFVLGVILRHNILSMSEIGCKLSMPKPHVTAHIDKLIAEDMVERIYDPSDRRIINIRLTEKGVAKFKAIKQNITEEMRKKIELLDDDKKDRLFAATLEVKTILNELIDEQHNITHCKKEL